MKGAIKLGIFCIFAFIAVSIPKVSAAGEDSTYSIAEDNEYTVTIPSEVEVDSTTKTANLTFSGAFYATNELTINVSSANGEGNYLIYQEDGKNLDQVSYKLNKTSFYYSLTGATAIRDNNGQPIAFSNENDPLTLTITGDPKYAENYSGQLTFTITRTSVNYLDMNGILDGNEIVGGNFTGIATANVYVNGTLVSQGADDFWSRVAYGTPYEVTNVKTNSGWTYIGEDSYSGTVTDKWQRVDLPFMTNYDMTLNACDGIITSTNADGSTSTSNTATITIDQKNYYDKLPTPTREGYIFEGWWTAEDGIKGAMEITAENALMVSDYRNLYAHWSKEDDSETHSYYFDINSYNMDAEGEEQAHHELLSDYGSATVTVNGTQQYVDYQQFDKDTVIKISNVTANAGYSYLGYYIAHRPYRAGEELSLNYGMLQHDETIEVTLTNYTSIYFAFEKEDSESTESTDSSGSSNGSDSSGSSSGESGGSSDTETSNEISIVSDEDGGSDSSVSSDSSLGKSLRLLNKAVTANTSSPVSTASESGDQAETGAEVLLPEDKKAGP